MGGRTALHVAAQALLSDLCMVILSRPDFTEVNAVDISGKTALHTAAGVGLDEVCLAIILTSGFSEMNAVDRDGQRVLHVAASAGLREVCLAAHRKRPTDIAARKGLTDVCRAILARKGFTEVNARDASNKTSLHLAAAAGLTEVCQAILQRRDFLRLVLAITEDEQLLTMLRSMDIGTWLRFFESRNHADGGICKINQVCHWSVQCLLECHGALALHCGRFGKRAQLTWYIIIFFEIFVHVTVQHAF